MSRRSDEDLMRDVRAGRSSALAVLFERHHTRLYRFCLHMIGDRHVAEDLVQEVFMRMLKFRTSYRGDAAFAPWMFRIARNACVDHLRRAASETPPALYVEDNLAGAPDAESRAAELERSELVKRALLALPVQGREVLVLSRFEFKTYEEIARVLGCSVGAVKVRAHRALKQLREIYVSLTEEPST